MKRRSWQWAGILSAVVLGLIFLVAGLGKLPAQTDAYTILLVLRREPFLGPLSDYVHIIIPLLELAVGLLLVSGIAVRAAAVASLGLTCAFVYNNLWLIRNGLAQEPCHCFGGSLNWLFGVISTRGALVIDIFMLALICLILARYPRRWFSLRPWFLGERNTLNPAEGSRRVFSKTRS